jgi:hypothetical protein
VLGFSHAFQREVQTHDGMFLISFDFCGGHMDMPSLVSLSRFDSLQATEHELIIRRSKAYSRRLLGARVSPTYALSFSVERGFVHTL